jgi:single-strand DNA-binding protein
MFGINRVQLLGNLGRDPEIKFTPAGACFATLSVATNERYKDKSGEWKTATEWHRVILWQRLAELAGEFLQKGSGVLLDGKLQTRSWETNGIAQYSTEILVRELRMLYGLKQAKPAAASAADPEPAADPSGEKPDDDIPF